MRDFLFFDGAMGTMLQMMGLQPGEKPESLNITAPETVLAIHKEYVNAGADVITANTFGANSHKYGEQYTEAIEQGIRLAKMSGAAKVAMDIGPIGTLLKPIGTMDFETAYNIFKEEIVAGCNAGADIILIETMSDLLETKAAILAARENTRLPVFATMSFAEDGRTFLGTDAKTAAITLSSLGVDACGVNCSLGPDKLFPVVAEFVKYSRVPVMVQPNADLPVVKNGQTVYNIGADEFALHIEKMADMGVVVFGGCCGTTPEYIRKIKERLMGKAPTEAGCMQYTAFTSGRKTVFLRGTGVIGERINPTGKKKLKEAISCGDFDYIVNEAIAQEEHGADVLDVNVGVPGTDEKENLVRAVKEVQAVSALPLQIDSSDAAAIDAALRVYNGKPIINSVNGKEESMNTILPIAKKYGAAIVALTLDDDGIPQTAEKRLEIAKKIIARAEQIGIPKEDILVDCLVMAVSADSTAASETIKAVRLVREIGVKTVLGVSNVSFGLPSRPMLNSAFLAAAFGAGLNMPILNPLSKEYMDTVLSFRLINGEDEGAKEYIERFSVQAETVLPSEQKEEDIGAIIIKGKKTKIVEKVKGLLEQCAVEQVINDYFIPSLNEVGAKFEKGEIFLPQLMSSAETVKEGFDYLKAQNSGGVAENGRKILLATVKGDIHDIGKNIVKMFLENYGYRIIDLGRDVEPSVIVNTVKNEDIKLVGLSALMTTTVKYMKETIDALKKEKIDCKIMVGGAVLTPDFAKELGADYYARDAAESARIAGAVLK